jgi:F-type H+-transporting ATPase subunit delta
MKSITIARNYAEALFEAADDAGKTERYGEFIDAVAGAVASDPRIAVALDSPRVAKAEKGAILRRALDGLVPDEFVRFLEAVVRRGRQGLLGEIAVEYQRLLDTELNRVEPGLFSATAGDGRSEGCCRPRLATRLARKCGRISWRMPNPGRGRGGRPVFDSSRRRLTAMRRRRMLAAE